MSDEQPTIHLIPYPRGRFIVPWPSPALLTAEQIMFGMEQRQEVDLPVSATTSELKQRQAELGITPKPKRIKEIRYEINYHTIAGAVPPQGDTIDGESTDLGQV